mgnify:CR=1 FL=1
MQMRDITQLFGQKVVNNIEIAFDPYDCGTYTCLDEFSCSMVYVCHVDFACLDGYACEDTYWCEAMFGCTKTFDCIGAYCGSDIC